ncbi:hypothetical protein JCM39194_16970 [Desulfotomaculum varum]
MGKKVTFSEGAELLGVPISTISKWFSQGLFKTVELDRKSPGGPTYLLRLEELLAIKDALEAERRGNELAKQEIAAAQEKQEPAEPATSQARRRLSLVKSPAGEQPGEQILAGTGSDPGKEIVLKIQEDTAMGLVNALVSTLNNFEQKFLSHLAEQADRNAMKYNTMAIEHLDTLRDMSTKMEKLVDALLTMPKVNEDTARVVNDIKEMLPNINQIAENHKGTQEKLEVVGKKLEKLSEEIKDTKWAVVKLARDNHKAGKKYKRDKDKAGFGWVSGIGKILGFGK